MSHDARRNKELNASPLAESVRQYGTSERVRARPRGLTDVLPRTRTCQHESGSRAAFDTCQSCDCARLRRGRTSPRLAASGPPALVENFLSDPSSSPSADSRPWDEEVVYRATPSEVSDCPGNVVVPGVRRGRSRVCFSVATEGRLLVRHLSVLLYGAGPGDHRRHGRVDGAAQC